MQMTKLAFFAVAGLASCGTGNAEPTSDPANELDPVPADPAQPPPDPAALAAVDSIDENLERLRTLGVFEVRDMIVQRPAEAANCYGLPCADSAPALADLTARAALRLASLAEVAEGAFGAAYAPARCIERVDQNLQALRALEIIEVGAFISVQPANNPNCYSLPCSSDIEAANLKNEARAADLESISVAAQSL
jgi:hypothetical protein